MPPRSKAVNNENEFDISEADKLSLLNSLNLRPSELKSSNLKPLILSPSELTELANKQAEEDDDEDDEEEEVELWEELVNALFISIPFGFLYAGLDYAVHAQYGQELLWREELGRLINIFPALLILTFLTSRPPSKAFLPPLFLQLIYFLSSLSTGITLIHLTESSGYMNVMRHAPGIAILWVWSIVKMDLGWAVGSLVGVAAGVMARGEGSSVIWWK